MLFDKIDSNVIEKFQFSPGAKFLKIFVVYDRGLMINKLFTKVFFLVLID